MSEITTSNDNGVSRKFSFVWLAFFALVLFVYFFGLTIPLLGPDEPRYAQVAREMMERGDWVTPTLGGFNWFEKPALLYWLEIVSYKFFGVNEFAARFGPALFGLGTIASLWILGRFLARENTEKIITVRREQPLSQYSMPSVANEFAYWLALIAASTLGILVFSRGASFDIIITFPITASLVSFYIYDRTAADSQRGRLLPLTLFYFFIGVALLAKGLIGTVFPFGVAAFYYLLSRRLPSRTFIISLFWGTLISLAVASVWYLPMYLKHGYAFIDEFFVQQHFQRFTSNKFQHPQPFYFFLWVLPLMTIPWMPFFIAAIWKFLGTIFLRKDLETKRENDALPVSRSPILPFSSTLLHFTSAWLLVPLVFFSFSGSKLPGYILPAVPASIILVCLFLIPLLDRSRSWRLATASISLSTLLLSVALLIWAVPRFADSDSIKGLVAAASERGYSKEKVLGLNTLSHNAEFYAAGRLLRDEKGKQRRLYAPSEIRDEIEAENGSPVLVLVPLENLTLLTRNDSLNAEVLSDNGELAIVLVATK